MSRRVFSRVGNFVFVAGVCLLTSNWGLTPVSAAPDASPGPFAGVTQNWDKNLPSASRFTVLSDFNNEAVRDNNTGLVWQRSPDTEFRQWDPALTHCIERIIGGSFGWRLPSVVELTSILDPSLPQPFVPVSVFPTVAPGVRWWSATQASFTSDTAWVVFTFITNNLIAGTNLKIDTGRSWCVRGPMNADRY